MEISKHSVAYNCGLVYIYIILIDAENEFENSVSLHDKRLEKMKKTIVIPNIIKAMYHKPVVNMMNGIKTATISSGIMNKACPLSSTLAQCSA